MSAKPTIAGILWLLFGLLSLLGFAGLAFLSMALPDNAYLLANMALALVLGLGFVAAGIELLRRKKRAFMLGIAVPAIDIVLSIALTAWILVAPAALPAELAEATVQGIAGSAVGIVIELIGIALVYLGRAELVK